MNVIFLTLSRIDHIEKSDIYSDLMRKFRREGHKISIVQPIERRECVNTHLREDNGVQILEVRTLNLFKTNIVEKGISTLLIEYQFKCAIQKYLSGNSFDLITYSTPPITFKKVVSYLKQKNPQAISYLLLKDIFPQNAVDMGLFGKKSLFNWFFRRKEVDLYKCSDYIGCMSPANVKYLLNHNPYYPADRVEVAPNSIELKENCHDSTENNDKKHFKRSYIRSKYQLPTDKPIFIYGGNLGKPQGIEYLIKCLDAVKKRKDCFFLIVGTGTYFHLLSEWYQHNPHTNVKVMKYLPKEDYDLLVESSDVGLIFLDNRFTIPNYPSRLLSYLEYKMPIICATDVNTDIGSIAQENGYGYWCESVKPEDFVTLVNKMLASDRKAMGELGYRFLKDNYLVEHTYNTIIKHF